MMQRHITVTSTGAMGSAVAAAFLAGGLQVTVWNRSADKALPLASKGATIAQSIHEAVESSEIIVAVPNPYDAAEEYLLNASVSPILRNKTIVLLSSYQHIADPTRLERAFSAHGAIFIDGKILCYPSEIGRDTALLAFSGSEMGYNRIVDLLNCLGHHVYLGSEIDRAFIFECGLTPFAITVIASAINSLSLFISAGIPPEALEKGVRATFRGLENYLGKVVTDMVPNGNFDPAQHGTATVSGMLEVAQHFPDTFEQFRVRTDIFNAVKSAMSQLAERGDGGFDMAAMTSIFKLCRQ